MKQKNQRDNALYEKTPDIPFLLIILLAGKEQNSFLGTCQLGRSCWKVGTAIYFTATLETQLLIFSGAFELDIILQFSELCSLHAPD